MAAKQGPANRSTSWGGHKGAAPVERSRGGICWCLILRVPLFVMVFIGVRSSEFPAKVRGKISTMLRARPPDPYSRSFRGHLSAIFKAAPPHALVVRTGGVLITVVSRIHQGLVIREKSDMLYGQAISGCFLLPVRHFMFLASNKTLVGEGPNHGKNTTFRPRSAWKTGLFKAGIGVGGVVMLYMPQRLDHRLPVVQRTKHHMSGKGWGGGVDCVTCEPIVCLRWTATVRPIY